MTSISGGNNNGRLMNAAVKVPRVRICGYGGSYFGLLLNEPLHVGRRLVWRVVATAATKVLSVVEGLSNCHMPQPLSAPFGTLRGFAW